MASHAAKAQKEIHKVIAELSYSTRWWAWWSNPLTGIHQDHKQGLPYLAQQLDNPDYACLLEIRSLLNLDDCPDMALQEHLLIRALCLATAAEITQCLQSLAILSLDDTILNARPQDWETLYGVSSPELIRHAITQHNQLPDALRAIQNQLASKIAQKQVAPLMLNERIHVVAGAYLRSYFPRLFNRWKLSFRTELIDLISHTKTLPTELFEPLTNWLNPCLSDLHNEVFQQFEIPMFNDTDEDFNFEDDMDDTFTDRLTQEESPHA